MNYKLFFIVKTLAAFLCAIINLYGSSFSEDPVTPMSTYMSTNLTPSEQHIQRLEKSFNEFLESIEKENMVNFLFDIKDHLKPDISDRGNFKNLFDDELNKIIQKYCSCENVHSAWEKVLERIKKLNSYYDSLESLEINDVLWKNWLFDSNKKLNENYQMEKNAQKMILIKVCRFYDGESMFDYKDLKEDDKKRFLNAIKTLYKLALFNTSNTFENEVLKHEDFCFLHDLFKNEIYQIECNDDVLLKDFMIKSFLKIYQKINEDESQKDLKLGNKFVKSLYRDKEESKSEEKLYNVLKRLIDVLKIIKKEGEDPIYKKTNLIKLLKNESEKFDIIESESNEEKSICELSTLDFIVIKKNLNNALTLCLSLDCRNIEQFLNSEIERFYKSLLKDIKRRLCSKYKDDKKDISQCRTFSHLIAAANVYEGDILNELNFRKIVTECASFDEFLGKNDDVLCQEERPKKKARKDVTIQIISKEQNSELEIEDEQNLKNQSILGQFSHDKAKRGTHCPHDRFIQVTFENILIAQDFLKYVLPKSIIDEIDIGTLHTLRNILHSGDLSEKKVNSLFSVKLKSEEKFIYIMLKHLSAKDKNLPQTIRDYVYKIKETHVKLEEREKIKYVPGVISIILYTGEHKLQDDYWNALNLIRSSILDCFSFNSTAMPPVVLADMHNKKLVDKFDYFQITAHLLRFVRQNIHYEIPVDRLKTLLQNKDFVKYVESVKKYITEPSTKIESSIKMNWKKQINLILNSDELSPTEFTPSETDFQSPFVGVEELETLLNSAKNLGEKNIKIRKILESTSNSKKRDREDDGEIPIREEEEKCYFEIIKVKGDGNCQFSSIILALTDIDKERHSSLKILDLRRIVVEELRKEKHIERVIDQLNTYKKENDFRGIPHSIKQKIQETDFENIIDEEKNIFFNLYCSEMEKDNGDMWADNLTLAVLANFYDLKINIMRTVGNYSVGDGSKEIFLEYSGDHYDYMRRKI